MLYMFKGDICAPPPVLAPLASKGTSPDLKRDQGHE
jgi:hypothetical protein